VELGAAIRAERGRLRLTQSDLAMVAGTSRQAIAALEQERGRVSTLVAVEATLRLHVKGLTHGDTLIERVRLTRERRKLSLREVAARAGVSVNTVREIEAGRGAVSSLIRLVKAFAPHAHFRGGASRSQKTGFVTVGRRISQTHNPSDYFPTPAPITRLLLDSEEFSTDHEILGVRAIEKVLLNRPRNP
jgi:transcriptional regulator with XRE-family HTH domain